MSKSLLSLCEINLRIDHVRYRSIRDYFISRSQTIRCQRDLLSNINLTINSGDSVAIIGENGSGKTTLARLMSRIIAPTSGEIKGTHHVRYISDSTPEMDVNLSGRENAQYLAQMYFDNDAEMKEKVSKALEFTELGDALDDPIRTYSLGMKRRLFFSIQTMYASDVIIFDELSSNMDAFFNHKVEEFLSSYKEQLKAQVWISHDSNFLLNNCHRGIVLKDGKVIFDGEIKAALKQYAL